MTDLRPLTIRQSWRVSRRDLLWVLIPALIGGMAMVVAGVYEMIVNQDIDAAILSGIGLLVLACPVLVFRAMRRPDTFCTVDETGVTGPLVHPAPIPWEAIGDIRLSHASHPVDTTRLSVFLFDLEHHFCPRSWFEKRIRHLTLAKSPEGWAWAKLYYIDEEPETAETTL